jgi:probable HAF family extracellular repeat protein
VIENWRSLVPRAGWGTAFSINDVGQVVGWSGFTAFLWTREKGMQDLNTLIPANSGWSLSLARSINLREQITGQGTIGGQQHEFLLTPVSD